MAQFSPINRNNRKTSQVEGRKQMTVKIDKVSEPIMLDKSRKSTADCLLNKRSGITVASSSNLLRQKDESDVLPLADNNSTQLADSLNKSKRFNLSLKKTNSLTKSINKRLKTSIDDANNKLKGTLRNALSKNNDDSDDPLMLGNQLDSSIEKEDWLEDITEDLTALGDIHKESTGYDNTLIKITEGSTPNTSKMFSNRQRVSPTNSRGRRQVNKASFFDESIITNKRDSSMNKLEGSQGSSTWPTYYFEKLFKEDHPFQEIFKDHFELTAKSYLLASKLPQSPDSFLVQKMIYLPPNPLSRLEMTRKENPDSRLG